MKKLLLSGSIVALLLPALAFAAYNDVSMDTTVVLTVNSITLNVSGSASTIESLVINPTTFVVTIKNGSSFQVTAPGRESLSADTGQGQNVNTCNGTESKLGYNLSGTSDTVTVTIAPSTTLCADVAEVGSSSKSDGSGGGGGTPAPQASPVAQLVTTTDFSSWTPAQKQAAIAQIRAALIPLIQQLIVLIQQQIASGNY
ncbi:MAG: hypothetical protein A3C70_00990 [Candidatus Zambryskibacteria bacterium RIFCSPHIGHO2_02_FULL_43_14]|uniref:Uncharacterized protein n=1 Tax=Candidatus Zambryskibacteria bacterium RIFCSPHIGHO2_02_FULL_43_14 TaxID=1802748 RepID=A0A1G2TE52_9BACT|nr:MAG: hypothetical protein A2829_03035 [Candidatus Zambryskibacteria bacterium RIFCSPHIGHO2_01_FULL_43_60]OHA95585.1 MAG: hypothetical protein A3C70_00990 [Candidatus Zambryskibacteria bacterium RIFCSPHIGHO2_02_FULL_43_14]OHB02940.1 MAG: hypothetical protein A3B03_03430 [Candidatus Zambryskibacteria bacterium RIFCSPLOWO2_01_FULL_42_41]